MPSQCAVSCVQEFDGGSRGNPGPAGFGSVLRDVASGRLVSVYLFVYASIEHVRRNR
jgi:ribonuclease HI